MIKRFLTVVALAIMVGLPGMAGAANGDESYSETLPQSAFEEGDASTAIPMLINEGVPVPEIISAATRNDVAAEAVVAGLLKAGVSEEEIVFHIMEGPMPSETALLALDANGIAATTVLGYLIKWRNSSGNIYETSDFMLQQGYSKEELLQELADADADRNLVVQVVRWFSIPPATVVAVYQPEAGTGAAEATEGFGHVFARQSIPQPALFAAGASRIGNNDAFTNRGGGVISPIQP